MDNFTIHSATIQDLKAISRLEKVCFQEDRWPLIDILMVLTSSGIVRLKAVSHTGNLMGFIAGDLHQSPSIGWIITLAVFPEFRRQKIASHLLQACETNMQRTTFRLSVREDNTSAIRLYTQHQYQQVDYWKNYYAPGVHALVMERWRA